MAGVSGNMDFESLRQRAMDAARAMADALGQPIVAKIRPEMSQEDLSRVRQQVSEETARAVGDGGRDKAGSPSMRWEDAPGATRYRRGAWDSPTDYPEDGLDGLRRRAAEGWSKTMQGGAYHAMMESGRFGRKWGSFLGGEAAEQQRSFSDAAATPEGRNVAKAMEEIEKLGKRTSTLMKDVAGGGPDAAKASEELKKVQKALAEVAESGKKAAEGLGGDLGSKLKGELEAASKDAGAGKMGPEEAGGKALSPRDLLGMVRNPQGFLMNGGMDALGNMLGLSPAAMGAAGMGAAVAGGTYLGWRFNEGRADDRIKDAREQLEDARLSRGLGNNFDFRGTFWNKDRTRADETVDSIRAREVLQSLGMGLDGFKGDKRAAITGIIDAAPGMGMGHQELASMVGAGMRSGLVGRDQQSVETYLRQMLGVLQRGHDNGVETNEKLSAIATLNARQVDAMGRLDKGAFGFNANMLDMLDKTGDPALRGEQGARTLAGLGGPLQSDGQIAMVLGPIMRDPKLKERLFKGFFGDKDGSRFLGLSGADQLQMMNEDPSLMAAAKLMALNSPTFKGVPSVLTRSLTGSDVNLRRLLALQDSGMSEADILKAARDPIGGMSHVDGALGQDLNEGLRGGRVEARDSDGRRTMQSIDALESIKGFTGDMKESLRSIDKKFSDFQDFLTAHPWVISPVGAAVQHFRH